MRGGRRTLALIVMLAMAVPAQAVGQTPPLLNWGEIIPGFTPGIDTSDANVCKAGRPQCVESVLRTMAREFTRLARDCDHNAIFQLGYMRTTEAYYESSQISGFYDDVPWMHHYDAVFAEYYIGPQRAWQRGRTEDVPPSWREAFTAADSEELSSLGNFLMGMNAHINRDLPFVLDDIGLTDANGASRKPDHERVNEFLNQVADDMGPEIVARLDPAWDTSPHDDQLVGLAAQQVVQEWRERAWNNATLMTYAPAPIPDQVAQAIEAGSAELASQLRTGLQADAPDTAARNDYCRDNWDNWAGGDGTYFDEQPEPAYDAPSIDLPNPAQQLDTLAALGIHVEVDPLTGITVTVAADLLTDVDGLLGDVPIADLLHHDGGGIIVDPVIGGLGGGFPRR